MRLISLFIIFIILLLSSCTSESEEFVAVSEKQILFDQISDSQSRIEFANMIKDDGQLNPFTWNFIYQGAGVGVGDFDNDGLVDVYFAGNQVSDKVYRNLGEWKFEDKTESFGIQDNTWSTGVSVVDINLDGLLDIYVCKHSFAPSKFSKENKLFINQGNFKFVESAEAFGLNDNGFSIQALFVDIDNDDDLDCYLVNQKMDNYTKILFPSYQASISDQQDKLYINKDGKYIESNLLNNSRKLSFGLNPVSADFDNNGYVDIHISTDYDSPDALFMNTKGKLSDEASSRFNHTSFYSMGSDIADINNDGLLDLFCVDMAYSSHYRSKVNMEAMDTEQFRNIVNTHGQYQYMFNTLQINDGKGGFQEIAQLANLQSTDWSWAPLFVDFDQDGKKDIIVSNGIPKDIRNNDLKDYAINALGGVVTPQNFRALYQKLTSYPVANMVFWNKGEYRFDNVSDESGMNAKGFSTGMAYADFDNDGDMDLIINNTNAKAGLYRNKSNSGHFIKVIAAGPNANRRALGKSVILYASDYKESYAIQAVRGYMSSSEAIAHFGIAEDQIIDSIEIRWDSEYRTVNRSPKHNSNITLAYSDKERIVKEKLPKSIFAQVESKLPTHQENSYDDYTDQVLLPHSISQNGPNISVGDINGDKLEDIYFGSSSGRSSQVLLQNSMGSFDFHEVDGSNDKEDGRIHFGNDKESSFFLASHGSGQYVKNDRRHGISQVRFKDDGVITSIEVPISKGDFYETLIYNDYLWTFERADASKYPSKCKASCYQMSEDDGWQLRQAIDLGMVTQAVTCDIDKDGDQDIIAVGEWMAVTILENDNGDFVKKEVMSNGLSSCGWWNSIELGDFNNDGKLDFVVGNLGLNNKFKPSKTKPFYVFSEDFDKDGSNDVVLAKIEGDKMVPIRGKECSSQEVDFINDKFNNYESFALASLSDIYGADILSKSSSDTIYSFTSQVFLQETLGFKAIDLPIEAQFGPIKNMIVEDINRDGNLDIVFAGNQYGVEVETVRYDASRGGVLYGDGTGEFKFVNAMKTGLNLNGDFRDLDTINIGGEKHLIASQNSGRLLLFKYNN